MKILLIEDNKKLIEKIEEYLSLESFYVDKSENGLKGFDKAMVNNYDCIVLDINMPKMDGFEVCERLRNEGINTPVLFLTALGDKKNMIKGLNLGADDYLSKPFDMEELVARINSLIRRFKNNTSHVLRHDDIEIKTKSMQVYKSGELINLSPVEYQLLRFLLLNKDTVVSRGDLIEKVWKDYDRLMFSRTVDVHIVALRKIIGKDVIKTVKGIGYIISS